jgi:TusA-related sulfurtransferase
MISNTELDLTGIVWPMCLLEFKRALIGLRSRGMMEVLVQDPEVAEQLILIVEHSENKLVNQQKEGETVRLFILKNGNEQR